MKPGKQIAPPELPELRVEPVEPPPLPVEEGEPRARITETAQLAIAKRADGAWCCTFILNGVEHTRGFVSRAQFHREFSRALQQLQDTVLSVPGVPR